jgi:hypothetical protein
LENHRGIDFLFHAKLAAKTQSVKIEQQRHTEKRNIEIEVGLGRAINRETRTFLYFKQSSARVVVLAGFRVFFCVVFRETKRESL